MGCMPPSWLLHRLSLRGRLNWLAYYGAFNKALVEGLEAGNANYDNDNSITIKEIDLYVTNRVKKLTNGCSTPYNQDSKDVTGFPDCASKLTTDFHGGGTKKSYKLYLFHVAIRGNLAN